MSCFVIGLGDFRDRAEADLIISVTIKNVSEPHQLELKDRALTWLALAMAPIDENGHNRDYLFLFILIGCGGLPRRQKACF